MVVNKKVLLITLLSILILLVIFKPWEVHAQGVTKVADLPMGVIDACSALGDDGNIYVFGGLSGVSGSKSSKVIKFNPIDKSVTIAADMGDGFEGGWAVNYNGKIYVGGGYYGNQPTSKVFIFDPANNSISSVFSPSSMNVYCDSGHGNIHAFVGNGYIYDFWGKRLSTYQATIKQYDPIDNTVTTISSPSTVIYYSLASNEGMAYIAGYYDNSATDTGILVFNPASNTLTKAADFPYMAGMSASFGADRMLYFIGGKKITTPGELKAEIIQYDPVNNTVVTAGSLPAPLANATATLANNGKIYVFGGSKSLQLGDATTDILEIDPATLTAPPGDFTLSGALDKYSAVLTWTVSSNATSYILERSADGMNFNQITETHENSYTDADLSPGTYYYRVTAQNDFGNMVSNTVIINVQQLAETPTLSVTLEGADADLFWTPVTGATNYILEKSTDGTSFTVLAETSGTSYTDPSLPPGAYYYRVSAGNDNGVSTPSNIVSVTVQPPTPERFWVYWPTGGRYVEVDWGRGTVDLSGDMVRLWRVDSQSGIWMNVKDISEQEKDSFTWLDTNVTSGLNYMYQVRVYEPATWSWRIAAESDWAAQDRPFLAPGGLRVAYTSDTEATVYWTAVNGASPYQVQISTDGGSTWQSSTVGGPSVTVPRPCMVRVMAGTHARSQWSGILRVND